MKRSVVELGVISFVRPNGTFTPYVVCNAFAIYTPAGVNFTNQYEQKAKVFYKVNGCKDVVLTWTKTALKIMVKFNLQLYIHSG